MPSAPIFTSTSNGLSLLTYGFAPGVARPAGSTATVAGVDGQSSLFTNGRSVFGIERGFLLTTGTGTPPTAPATLSVATGGPGSPLLETTLRNAKTAASTFDANTLTVTVNVTSAAVKTISFDVAFATEEFPLATGYADLAAITVNGVNVALANGSAGSPLGAVAASAGLFVDNRTTKLPIAYDAVTTRLTLTAPVKQGVNTIVFTVADAGDRHYDSALAVGNITLGGGASGGLVVPVVARDDRLLVNPGTSVTKSLIVDNGNGRDTGRAGPLTVTAVNGSAGLLERWITLPSGAKVKIFADGRVGFNAKALSAAPGSGDGLVVETITYAVTDGRTTDTAVATFGIFKAIPAAPIQLTFDDLGARWVGFSDLGRALAAMTAYSSSADGITLSLKAGFRGGDHILALDKLNLRAAAGSTAAFTFAPNVEDFTATGGNIKVTANNKSNHVVMGDGNDIVMGNGGHDLIEGGKGTNLLYGGTGNDTLIGGSGADLLNGGPGADVLVGGAGKDQLFIDPGDIFDGGADNDTAFLVAAGRYAAQGTSVEQWIGSPGADEIDGSGNGESLFLFGLDGNDTLVGGIVADKLVGGNGNDLLLGKEGRDNMNGGAGNDTLDGGPGNDVLVGAAGADRFRFTPGGNGDQILDWTAGVDKLDFSEHDGVSGMGDITITRSGPTAFVFYSADRSDYVVIYGAYANGAKLTADDFIF